MKHLLHTLAMMALLLVAVACSKDVERSESYTHFLYDVVTYVGTDAKTGNAKFELVGRDLTGSTMLQGNIAPDPNLKAPLRVLLRYNYADDGDAGAAWRQVKVFGVSSVHTDSLRITSSPIWLLAQYPVKMRSAWRTGDFINLHCQVEYTGKTRTMMMVVDESTRYDDTVHCYLNHDLRNETPYFWRECYVSVNVGNVWKRSDCKTFRLHVNDADRGSVVYDFDRL